MTIEELSGDSSVRDIFYETGFLSLLWDDNDTDSTYCVRIKTCRFLTTNTSEANCVHIRVPLLKDFLEVDANSGRYIAPAGFAAQMKMVKVGANLAIGLRADEYPKLIQIMGYELVLATLVEPGAEIAVEANVN